MANSRPRSLLQPTTSRDDDGGPQAARLPGETWHQVALRFTDYATAEAVAPHLGAVMAQAEDDGLVGSWSFIRKAPCWRLRFQSAPIGPATNDSAAAVSCRLDALRAAGHVAGWTQMIYEPEIHAFGGAAAMDLAHQLFHHDSRRIIAYLATQPPGTPDRRRELSLLLCGALLRAAGQDWYEQGDIWARVAATRPTPPAATSTAHALGSRLRQLLVADTSRGSPLTTGNGPLADQADWLEAFTDAGRRLAALAHTGVLERGVRAVLAHHILFHWNRLGLPSPAQALLAHTAKSVIFG